MTSTPLLLTNKKDTIMKTKELSHAAQNLVIYEIYERYTLEAVAMVVKAKRTNGISGARLDDVTAWDNLSFWIGWQTVTKKAIQAAAKLVRKYDHIHRPPPILKQQQKYMPPIL